MTITQFLKNAEKIERYESKVPEKTIEKKFCKAAEKLGFKPLKVALIGLRGWPDRTVIGSQGRIFFVEFKTETGKLSAAQLLYKSLIESLGFNYYVCNSIAQIDQILSNNFLDDYPVTVALVGEDHRYPTLLLNNDRGAVGYNIDPDDLTLTRCCLCYAHSASECLCGAWDD